MRWGWRSFDSSVNGSQLQHRLPHQLVKPKFDNNNFEESFTTWEFQLARFERDNGSTSQDSSTLERNHRTSTTTSPTPGRHNYNLCTNQNNNHGILQSNNSLYKVGAATRLVWRSNELWRRTSTNGHRSHQQGQRQIQRSTEQRKR